MLRLGTDENFNGDVVRGLLRQEPHLDLARIQDAGLEGADDPTILQWAADEGRILLTHDRATMPRFGYDRVRAGLPMPGIFVVSNQLPVGQVIAEVLLLATCTDKGEWANRVVFLPV
jgi:Domain of unknown function (DUF5615)